MGQRAVFYYGDRGFVKQQSSLNETACRFARGVVAEWLSQGQMTGLCAETYSPFLSTFNFLGCKGMVFLRKLPFLLLTLSHV